MSFKSCWTACRPTSARAVLATTVALLQACSSLGSGAPGAAGVPEQALASGGRLGVDRLSEFQGSLFCQGELVGNDGLPPGEPDAGAVFERFCRGGRPMTELREAIRFVVPPTAHGIPLDEAARGREGLLARVRKLLQDFYIVATQAAPVGPRSARHCGTVGSTQPYFHGLPYSDPGRLEWELKDSSTGKEEPYFFMKSQARGGRIYLMRNRTARYRISSGAASGEFEDAFEDGTLPDDLLSGRLLARLPQSRWPSRGMFVASTQELRFRVRGQDGKETLRRVFPLRQATEPEAVLLKRAFTLAVPADVQSQVSDRWHMGLNPDGTFALTELLRDRERIWNRYFHRFTTVKEAPGDDSRIIDYEVSLDLGLFCSYGRPVKDLVTR